MAIHATTIRPANQGEIMRIFLILWLGPGIFFAAVTLALILVMGIVGLIWPHKVNTAFRWPASFKGILLALPKIALNCIFIWGITLCFAAVGWFFYYIDSLI